MAAEAIKLGFLPSTDRLQMRQDARPPERCCTPQEFRRGAAQGGIVNVKDRMKELSRAAVEGLVVPLLTPVDEGERVDEASFRALIRHCLDGGADALFAGGTSGMGPLWPMSEWERMMAIARDEVGNGTPLLGGVIETSTVRAIERIRALERCGYDTVVITPTFYIDPRSEEEFLAHFGGCREATDLEMIVYNIPSCTHVSIPVTVIAEMADRGWTRCIKESSGNQDYFLQVMDAVRGRGVRVLEGFEPHIAWGFRKGARGIVPVCANYAPSLFAAVCRAAAVSDGERMDDLQDEIMAVRDTLLLGDKNWLAGAMFGVSTLGIGSGNILGPIQSLKRAERQKIETMTSRRGR